MIGGVSTETCWAIKKHWNNKFYYFFVNVYMVLFLFNNVIYVFLMYDYVFSLYVYVVLFPQL